MNKNAIKAGAAALVLGAGLVLVSCGEKDTGKGQYTYRTSTGSFNTWSPTDWQLNNENAIVSNITSPLYDFVLDASGNGYEIIPELAESMPVDVTAQYAGNPLYGVPAGATKGYAHKIKIIDYAKWDNGTPINVDTIEYSLRQFLNPDMKNYRGNSFYGDALPLANAAEYYAGSVKYTDAAGPAEGLWTSLTQPVAFFGDAASSYGPDSAYGDVWVAEDGSSYWDTLESLAGGKTYFEVTPEVQKIIKALTAGFGDDPSNWYQWCLTREEVEATPFENVGFIKNGDYEFTLITTHPLSDFMFIYNVTSVLLLREDLYEANKKATGDIIKSSYGTAVENTASYGPYYVSEYQEGKVLKLAKNENWYGYTDGRHKNQYMTTGMEYQVLYDHETILNLFLQGNLDDVTLAATDFDKYANSDYRVETPQSYTYKFTINIDRRALQAEDADGVIHSVLANEDFRHGLSLASNRQQWVETTSPSSDPGYGLINNAYVAVPETGALYRDTPQAQKTLMDFYGVKNIDDITGYDLTAAREYFQKAYESEVKNGYFKPTDRVSINYHCGSASEGNQRRVNFLQDAFNKGTEGTGFEGKVTVNLVVDQNYYTNLPTGAVDMALTAWGGSSMDPYGVLWCYCTDSALLEYGLKIHEETVTVNLNGKNVTKTFADWYEALCNGEYTDSDNDTKNTILAAVEYALLSHYNMIPVEYLNDLSLDSQRLIEGADHFVNQLVGRGGIRALKYSMDDAEWDAYCKKQNNQLKY